MKRKSTDVVRFKLSIGFVGAVHTESQTLEELGLEQEELDEMDSRELEKFLGEQQQAWAENYIELYWSFE